MSDDLDIRGGGTVVVDTDSVRHAASGFEGVAAACKHLAGELAHVGGVLAGLGPFDGDVASTRARVAAIRVDEARAGAAELARRLRVTAAEYERVDLEAARAAAIASGDEALARLLGGRLVAWRLTAPTGAGALPVGDDGFVARHGGLVDQWARAQPPVPWGLTAVGFGAAGLVAADRTGAGTVPARARLQGPAPRVRVFPLHASEGGAGGAGGSTGVGRVETEPRPPEAAATAARAPGPAARPARAMPGLSVPTGAAVPAPFLMADLVVPRRTADAEGTPASAPRGLAAAVARVPNAGDERVRVERYTMPDGSRQFAVYVAGTQSAAPSGVEAWDLGSNLQLYGGEPSASYQATVQALRQVGAGPDDPVHAFGYSQGGMIAARLALEDEFSVRTLVTFGSPVHADVGPGTVGVALRHADDPVAALAAGGFAATVGAHGSFVAERTADPVGGVRDLLHPFGAHALDAYAETAGMLDASADPRMDAVREVFAGLEAAASVETTVFGAERVVEPRPSAAKSLAATIESAR